MGVRIPPGVRQISLGPLVPRLITTGQRGQPDRTKHLRELMRSPLYPGSPMAEALGSGPRGCGFDSLAGYGGIEVTAHNYRR